jgi:hypothetical protein
VRQREPFEAPRGLAPKPSPDNAGARADADPSDPRHPDSGTKALAGPSHAGAAAPTRVSGAITCGIAAAVAGGPTITTPPTRGAVTITTSPTGGAVTITTSPTRGAVTITGTPTGGAVTPTAAQARAATAAPPAAAAYHHDRLIANDWGKGGAAAAAG